MISRVFTGIAGFKKLHIRLFALVVLLLFIVLGVFMSKAGIRGSDQYWYVADTESLLNGNGVQTNNILFTNIINDSIVENKGFIHNVPQVYMAVVPGLIFGAYNGWLIMNVFFNILSAVILLYTLHKFLGHTLSILVAVLYLVLPLTFWQSYQPLSESFHTFLLTAMLFIYYYNDKLSRYFIIGFLTVVLLLCRNNYFLLAPIISILFYTEIKYKNKFVYSFLFFGIIIVLNLTLKSLFPDTWNFNFYDTIVTNKVGVLNFNSFLELLKIYSNNFLVFVKKQFITTDYLIVYYLPFNLFVIGTIILWFKQKNKKETATLFLVITSITFVFLTSIFFQNQARYLLPFYPLVIFSFFVQLQISYSNLNKSGLSTILIFTIIISLFVNFGITRKTLQAGQEEKSVREYYTTIYNNTIPINESVIFCDNNFLLNGYILRPRNMFLGNENNYLSTKKYSTLINQQKIKWLISKNNYNKKKVFVNYNLEIKKVYKNFNGVSQLFIYKITPNHTHSASY